MDRLITGTTDWAIHNGPTILAAIVLVLVGIRLTRFLSVRLAKFLAWRHGNDPEVKKRAETLSAFVRYAVATAAVAVGLMMVLSALGVNIAPILAGAGIVGLAVGFGAQTLVQDVISGFFILLEDQIRVGDVVEVRGKSGLVERVGLRTTTLRDFAGNVHFVRNGQIEVITNMTKGYSHFVLDIRISYQQDIDAVAAVVRAVDEELRADPAFKEDILKPAEFFGLDQFGESAIVVRARITTKPIRQWHVGREFNRRMKKRFDEQGIEIPFRQMKLHLANASGLEQSEPAAAPPISNPKQGAP